MNITAASLALVVIVALAACSAPSDPEDARNTGVSPVLSEVPDVGVSPGFPAQASTSSGLTITPPSLPGCEPRTVTVEWDFSERNPPPATVDIEAVDGNGQSALFASGGAAGSSETGPWAIPGAVFVARDRSAGMELSRARIAGPDCATQ